MESKRVGGVTESGEAGERESHFSPEEHVRQSFGNRSGSVAEMGDNGVCASV